MKNFKKAVVALVLSLGFVFLQANHSQAQVTDTTGTKKDSTIVATDTTVVAKDTVVVVAAPVADSTAPKAKSKSTFIIYAGPNVSTLRAENEELSKESEAGFHVGVAWRTKGFIYGQFGVRYNSPSYSVRPAGRPDSGDHKFTIGDIDFPITAGINILAATDKVLNLRGFLSAVPAFNLSVSDNDYGYNKDKINSFVFYGQAGIGADFLFLVLEVGYNYGFSDIIKDVESKPGQGFVNIGVRF